MYGPWWGVSIAIPVVDATEEGLDEGKVAGGGQCLGLQVAAGSGYGRSSGPHVHDDDEQHQRPHQLQKQKQPASSLHKQQTNKQNNTERLLHKFTSTNYKNLHQSFDTANQRFSGRVGIF